ncbi:MAG: hypothetical protein MUD03_01525 [Pirellula sp.]|jgi:hypothetical protein|nr:hypothetical protein [Pirellula sp.]
MNRSSAQVIGIECCTLNEQYCYSETVSAPVIDRHIDLPRERTMDAQGKLVSLPFPSTGNSMVPSDRVTVRVRDLAAGLRAMAAMQLAWLEDLGDDPIVLTQDFYEVFLACQKVRRAG